MRTRVTPRFQPVTRKPWHVAMGSDIEVRDHQPDVITAASRGIAEVVGMMGLRSVFDEEYLGQEAAIDTILEAHRQPNPNHGGSQINAPEVAYRLAREGGLTPDRPIYLLTAKDLFAHDTNFVFGVNFVGLGISIQSTARFLAHSRDPRWLAKSAQHMARHEFGHQAGLNDATITYQDMRGGIAAGHCRIDPCTMNQVMSVTEAGRAIYRLEDQPNAGFCQYCVGALATLGAQR